MRITEGKAVISVPDQPVTRKAEAFYNPEMEYQRDVTMSFLRVLGGKLSACDPLAGTGIRSIRMALEVPGFERIVANDLNPLAVKTMKKNLRSNGIDAEVFNMNANDLFSKYPDEFDFIDIDPFGSHIGYVFGAGYALKSRSALACTATDTGALCGAFPSTCLKRYGIKNLKTDFYKEVGVRVMITSIMNKLSEYGMAFSPSYSHANHYFRVLGKVKKSASMLSKQADNIRPFVFCSSCLYRSFDEGVVCPNCGGKTHEIGPLWTGTIHDRNVCKAMLKDLEGGNYGKTKELGTAVDEIDEPFYFDAHRLFSIKKIPPKRMEDVLKALKDDGFKSSRTHLCGTGIKTDAQYSEIIRLL